MLSPRAIVLGPGAMEVKDHIARPRTEAVATGRTSDTLVAQPLLGAIQLALRAPGRIAVGPVAPVDGQAPAEGAGFAGLLGGVDGGEHFNTEGHKHTPKPVHFTPNVRIAPTGGPGLRIYIGPQHGNYVVPVQLARG